MPDWAGIVRLLPRSLARGMEVTREIVCEDLPSRQLGPHQWMRAHGKMRATGAGSWRGGRAGEISRFCCGRGRGGAEIPNLARKEKVSLLGAGAFKHHV